MPLKLTIIFICVTLTSVIKILVNKTLYKNDK